MFYGMTNTFSFFNVNTNKEKSINTLESFAVLFPEDSSRCFLLESVAEYARYRSPRVIWKRLRQFKAIVIFFFSLKSSRYPYFTSSKIILVRIQNIHVVTMAQQSVNEFKKGKSK